MKQGNIYSLRRSLEKYPEAQSQWDIVGGRIDQGETLLVNLQREVTEEIGLKIVGVPKLIAAQDIIIPEKEMHVVRLTYAGSTSNDEISLDVSENDLYKWVTWNELKAMKDVDKYLKALLDNVSLWANK